MKNWLPVLLLFLVFTLSGQSVWQKIIPGDKSQQARDVAPAADGNFWVLTNYRDGFNDSTQVNLLKINLLGEVVDTRVFLKTYGMTLQTFDDGSLAILGQRLAMYSSDGQAVVIKLNAQGDLLWQTELEVGYAHAMIADPSGGYFVGGLFDQTGAIDQSFITHLSATGMVSWTKKYNIVSTSAIQSFHLLGNEMIAVGGTTTIGAGLDGFFLLKVNATTGNQIWKVTQDVGFFNVDLYGYYEFPPIGVSTDVAGNILVACPGNPKYADGSGIYRFSPADGALLQQIKLTSFSYERYPMDLLTDADGNLIIAGAGGVDNEHLRPFIEKRSANGQVIWSRRLLNPGQLTAFTPSPDGGFIACGIDHGSSYLQWPDIVHTLLVRFDSLGNAFPCRIEGFVRRDDNQNCLSEPGDPPLRNWNLLVDDTLNLSTDANGYFRADLPEGDHQLRLLSREPVYSACEDEFVLTTTLNNPIAEMNFPVQKGPDCPLLEVGITHTDLIACDTSVLYVSWHNRGNASADNTSVTVQLDPALSLLDASQPFSQNGQELTFPIGPMPADSSGALKMQVRLHCDAPLFSTHVVEARIEPVSLCWTTTPAGWNGPVLRVAGECSGDEAHFTVTNQGGTLQSPLPYQLFVDAALVETGTLQPQADQPFILDYAAGGRTVALQTGQAPGYPVRSFPSAAVEGCGALNNGLVSTGFVRMLSRDDAEPWVSRVVIESGSRRTGDRIFEIPQGYGRYHFLEPDTVPLEFSLRLSNSFDQTAQEMNLTLFPSAQFDLSTFELLGWSHPLTYEISNNGEIFLRAGNLGLLPGEEFQLRFRLAYSPLLTEDFISVGSEAFLDGQGPLHPYEAFFNIGQNFTAQTITPDSDDPYVKIFGRGNAMDFTSDLAQLPNGDMVHFGVTSTFGEGQDLYLLRSDSTGKGIWQKSYRLGEGANYGSVILPLPDNSMLVAGSFEDVALENYLNYSYAYIAHLAADGALLWVHSWKPGTGGTVVDGALTPDGNAVFWGVGYTASTQKWLNFLVKISPDNEVVWQKTYAQFEADQLLGGRLKPGNDGYLYYFGAPDNFLSDDNYRLIRLNWNGNVVASAGYINPPDEYPYLNDFTPTPDGGLLIAGSQFEYDDNTQSYLDYVVLAKLNAQFGLEWLKKHQVDLLGDITAVEAAGGSYFLSGDMYSDTININSFDALMVKADSAGDLVWMKTFPVNTYESGDEILIGQHQRVWMTAQTQSADNVYNLQMLLMRASDPDALVKTQESPAPKIVQISPNPANRMIWLSLPEAAHEAGGWQYDIRASDDRLLRQGQWQAGAGIPVQALPNGGYLLRLWKNDEEMWVGRFLVQR